MSGNNSPLGRPLPATEAARDADQLVEERMRGVFDALKVFLAPQEDFTGLKIDLHFVSEGEPHIMTPVPRGTIGNAVVQGPNVPGAG